MLVCAMVDFINRRKIISIFIVGILVDSEIVLSTRYGKTRVFINKT